MPLLKMSRSEKNSIALWNVIGGFSLLSGVTEQIGAYFTAGAALPISFGVIGIVGGGIGGYKAYREIQDEEARMMQIRKELFILINLAFDELHKIPQAQMQEGFDNLPQQYKNFVGSIQHALCPNANHKEEISEAIHKIICDYKREGVEQGIWEQMTAEVNGMRICYDNDFQHEACQLFVNTKNPDEINEYFRKRRQNHKFIMNDAFAKLDKEMPMMFRYDNRNPYNMMNKIFDNGKFTNAGEESYSREIANLHVAIEALKQVLSPENGNQTIYSHIHILESTIEIVHADAIQQNALNRLFMPVSRMETVFGKEGSFTHFLDQRRIENQISRPGERLDKPTMAFLGLSVLGGLYSTGKGIAMTVVLATGASAIGTMGISLAIIAIAAALTCLGLYVYRKAKTKQAARNELLSELKSARLSCAVAAQHNQQVQQLSTHAKLAQSARLHPQNTLDRKLDNVGVIAEQKAAQKPLLSIVLASESKSQDVSRVRKRALSI